MSSTAKRIAAAFAALLFVVPAVRAQTIDWTQQFGTATADEAWGIASDGTYVYTTGYASSVLDPGGNQYTWRQGGSGLNDLRSVWMVNADSAVAVGSAGSIVLSNDGGSSWVPAVSGTSADLRGVHFYDANSGLVVGATGVALRTSTGGAVWNLTTTGTVAGLNGVRYLTATRAVAVGDGGTVLLSSDGGLSWVQQSSGVLANLNAVDFSSASEGIAVGNGGTIISTSDGGITWSPVPVSPTTDDLFGVYVNGADMWVCGANAAIVHSADGGQTWNGRVSWFADTITSVYFADVDNGVIASTGGRLMRTNDGGANWFNQQLYPATLRAMSFFDAEQGIVVGDAGAVYQSVPQGPGQGWDFLLQKHDLAGNLIWTRQIGTAAQDFAHCVSTDGSVVFIGGETGGAMPGQVAGGNQDAVLACFTTNGILMWLTQFGNSGSEWIDGVAVYGDVYVTGIDNGSDVMVRRYSSSGPLLWNKPFGSTGIDIGQGITLGSPTEIYLVGLTLGTLPGQTSAGGQDMFIRRIDPAGNEVWTVQTGSANDDYLDAVYADASGVYASGVQSPGSGISDAFIAKYDTGGTPLWSDIVSTAGFDRGWSISGDSSSVTLAGAAGGALPGQTFAGGSQDGFLRRYSPTGSVLWTREFGTSPDDAVKAVVRVGGSDYVAGYTDAVLPGQTSAGGRDAFTMKVVSDVVPGRIYVSAAAAGANNGSSWADAFTSLQDALAIAVSGDSLWVAAGTYYPSSAGDRGATFQMMNGVVIYGGFTGVETSLSQRSPFANQTTLSGDIGVALNASDNSFHVVTAGGAIDATAILDGFYIRDGQADGPALDSNGGGLFNPGTGSPSIFNCTFESNYAAARGGGAYSDNGNPFFSTVSFLGNNAGQEGGGAAVVGGSGLYANVVFDGNIAEVGGGGMVAIGSPVFSVATFTNNQAWTGAGLQSWEALDLGFARFENNSAENGAGLMVAGGTATVYSSLFRGNSANGAGGGIFLGLNVTASLTNVTIAGNTAGTEGGGVRVDGNVNCAIANSIIYANTAPTGPQILSSGFVTYSHSLIANSGGSGPSWDGALGADLGGNIDDDPRFVNLLGGDLHLQAASPAIDTGDPDAVNTTLDLDTYPRVSGSRVDMGAYEFRGTCPPGNILYVNVAAVGGDGSSWAQAFTDLRSALAVAASCSTVTEIWVASGTYKPTNGLNRFATFRLADGVALYGGFAGDETDLSQRDPVANPTILSGEIGSVDAVDNSYHVVTVASTAGASTIFDGFTVQDGYANGGGSISNGAGMDNSGSPTIANVTFFRNHADGIGGGVRNGAASTFTNVVFYQNDALNDGGGIHQGNNDTVIFHNVVFRENSGLFGGGIRTGGSCVFTNVVFVDNTAFGGGGMMNFGDAVLTNTTFFRNSASSAGGGAMANGDASVPTIINSIFWANTATSGSNTIGNSAGALPDISYSLVQGSGGSGVWNDPNIGTDLGNNIDLAPLFMDELTGDVHLQVTSPGVNAGSNAAPNLLATDLDGVQRIRGGTVDMGAYESLAGGDSDGDGIDDQNDLCPFENASNFDRNNDGCIDDGAGGRHVEYWGAVDSVITYVISQNGAPGISNGSDFTAIQGAFGAWAAIGGVAQQSLYGGTTTQTVASNLDRVNLVTFDDNTYNFGSSVLAVGLSTSFTVDSTYAGIDYRAGQIVDADMLFNPNKKFKTPTSGTTGSDIQSVATHEAGHMFGLSHSTIVTSTMFYALPPGTRAAVLEADDALAFLKAYGTTATMSGSNRIEGGVFDGTTGDPIGGAIVFLIDAVTGDSTACDYTLPQTGEFSFVGIPDGDYYVAIHAMDGSSGVGYITPARINWLIASTPQTLFNPEYWDAAESNVEVDDNARTAITVAGGSQVTDVYMYPNIDATPPTVVSVDPSNGSTNAPAVGAVLIRFSEPVNSGTLVGNFALRDSLTQVAVGGNATFLRDDSLISFTPAPLAYNTTYELRLDTGLQDLFGNGLATPFVSYFRTQAPPGYGITALVPDKGVPGSVVVVVGNEFTSNPADFTVTFGGVVGTVLQASPTQIVVQVPPGAQSGDAVVTQVGQGTSNPVGFTVLPPLQAARAIPGGVSTLGSLPRAVDMLPSGGHAFVATELGASSVATDPAQGNYLSNVAIPITGGLVDLAVRTDGRRVYGVSFIDHTLSIIDSDFEGASPTVNTVRATLPLSAPPLGIAIEPTGNKAYIPTSDGEIQVWNISKSATASQVGVMIASDPNLRGRAAVDPVRNQLLALTGTGKVLFFDLATSTQNGQVSVGGDPRDVFIDPAGERAYITDNRGFVTIVSLASRLRVTPDMTTGGALRGVTGSPSGQYLFAANRLLNLIEVIDLNIANPTFRTVVNRIPQGINPVDVDMSPDGLYLYSLVEDTRQFVVTSIGAGPAITALSVSAAPAGAKIVVAGESLAADSLQTVSFNGIEVVPSALSNSQLTVTVPPGASSGPVQVIARSSSGSVSKSNEVYFEVLGPTTPGGLRLAAKAAPVGGDSTLTPAMAMSPTGNVMVFGSTSGDVWVMDVDPASATYNQVLNRFQPFLASVDDIAITPDGRRALVMSANALVALDINPLSPSYGTVVGTVDLSSLGGASLANIQVSPGGHRLLASDPGLDSVHIVNIDPASPQAYQLIGSIPMGSNVLEMAFHPGGRYAYVPLLGPAAQIIVIVDVDAGLVANTVVLPSATPAEAVMDLDFLPDGNRALMLTSQLSGPANRSVVMINTSNPVNPTLVNRQAFGVALSPIPEKIRVSPRGDRAIFAVRGQLFSHVAIEPDSVMLLEQSGDLFFHLTRVQMDYAPDGSRLYATSSFRDSVFVYDFSAAQTMTIASGNGQTGVINRELGLPLKVRVTDASANAVSGVAVRFSVTGGGGKFVDTGTATQIAATGIDGVATVRWSLGSVIGPGTQTVSAVSAGLANSPLVFTATSVDDPNNLPLQVTSILPLAGSTGVSVTTAVNATFTRSVAVSSVTTGTFFLQRVSDATRVAAVVGYANDRKQLSLTPDKPLEYNTAYALVIGTLRDDSGGAVTNPGSTSFTTRAGAPPLALTGVSPPSATPQATIVLSGASFDSIPSGNTVLFNDVAVTPFAAGLDFLNVKVPASAVSGLVSVRVGANTTAGKPFTVIQPMETNIDEVLATIGTQGSAAKSLTVNPDGTIAYSVSPEGNVVIPIDIAGLTTFPSIPVGREPVAIDMTPDGLFAFVANLQSGTVSVIDTDPGSATFNQVVETVVVGTAPVDLIVSPDGDRTFVALGLTNEIGVLDSDESSETHLQVLTSVPTGGTGTKSLTINPDGTELYVGDANGYVVIDPLTNGVLTNVPTGSASKSISITPDGTLLFIVTSEGDVLIIDNEVGSATKDQVIREIGTSGGTKSLAVNPDGTLLYLIQEESDIVLVLSIEVSSSVSIISDNLPPGRVAVAVVDTIDAGEDPEQLVFSPDGSGRALLTSPGDKTIVVLGTEPPVIAAEIVVKPHTLNLTSEGRWVSGIIELPSPYLPQDIDISTVMLQDSIPANPGKWSVGDADADGIPDLTVKFDRSVFQMYMPQGEYVPVTITGMVSGRAFAGEDTIRTIRPTLTKPKSFVLLAMGENTTIEWTSPNGYQVDYVDIFFSADNGENWVPVAQGIPDTHVIPWQAPLLMSEQCRILVTLYRYDSSQPVVDPNNGDRDRESEAIGSGMNQEPFVISAPVSLTLQSFEARMENNEAVLHWTTSMEVGTRGFNLYRSTDRDAGYALVNEKIIEAAGRLTGGDYQYRDKLAVGNQTYYYRLEEISGDEPSVFGPYEVRFQVVFDLAQNVPNPFNPTTTIKYAVPVRSMVNLTIYDVAGRVVTTLVNETRNPNAYTVTWDGTNNRGERVASGVYFYRIVAGKFRDTKKMVLLK